MEAELAKKIVDSLREAGVNFVTYLPETRLSQILPLLGDQVYSGARISSPTATAGKTDLEAMARGAGIEHSVTVRDIEAFKKEATAVLSGNELRFIVCKVEESLLHREIPRPTIDLAENKYRFVRYLEQTEGKANPFIGRG